MNRTVLTLALLVLTGSICGWGGCGGGAAISPGVNVSAPAIDGTATLNATIDGITEAGGDRGSATTTSGGTRSAPAGTLSNPGPTQTGGGS